MKIKIYTFLLLFLIDSLSTNAQTCLHKNLSDSFNFKVTLKRIKDNNCEIYVTIIKKKTGKEIQTIKLDSEFIFEKDFINCEMVRSYSTGINKDLIDVDNDYGDIIIADFNFDGREDFVIKKDSGGNGGPLYSYYIQNKNSEFNLDKFLSNNVEFFPSKINKNKKTLTTLVHANTYQKCKKTYQYNSKIKKWQMTSKMYIEY